LRNPLEVYRQAQLAIRREFDPFTRKWCPSCPTPCCLRPARIVPTDVLLAEASGWKSKVANAVEKAASEAGAALDAAVGEAPCEPCEHLGPEGCSFPRDLRPYGCTAYLCPVMYREMDRKALARVKRLARELKSAHGALLRRLEAVDDA
jgi:hypothetical protein